MRIRKGLAWIVWLIAPLALLEIGARAVFEPRETGLLAHRPIAQLYPDLEEPETIFEELSADSLEWRAYEHFAMKPGLAGKHLSTNALGLRGREVSVPKPEGVYRVAVLGASAAWGTEAARTRRRPRRSSRPS